MIPSNLMQVMLPKGKVILSARSSIPEVHFKFYRGMEILLNNQLKKIADSSSLQQLLNEVVGDQQKGIAIAINHTVVPRATWADYRIQANDNILIIKATQGG